MDYSDKEMCMQMTRLPWNSEPLSYIGLLIFIFAGKNINSKRKGVYKFSFILTLNQKILEINVYGYIGPRLFLSLSFL